MITINPGRRWYAAFRITISKDGMVIAQELRTIPEDADNEWITTRFCQVHGVDPCDNVTVSIEREWDIPIDKSHFSPRRSQRGSSLTNNRWACQAANESQNLYGSWARPHPLFITDIFCQFHQSVRIAPLVVIPGNNFDQIIPNHLC